MKPLIFAILLAGFAASAPALADTYAQLQVATVIANTPQIASAQPPAPNPKLPYYRVKGGEDVSGYVYPSSVSSGKLGNGQRVLIVPLDSGGTGRAFYALLWVRSGGGAWRFVGYVPSPQGFLSTEVKNGELVVGTPLFGPGDSVCCPKRFRYVRYTIDGIKLRELGAYTQ